MRVLRRDKHNHAADHIAIRLLARAVEISIEKNRMPW